MLRKFITVVFLDDRRNNKIQSKHNNIFISQISYVFGPNVVIVRLVRGKRKINLFKEKTYKQGTSINR
jgi:hypothetical protein